MGGLAVDPSLRDPWQRALQIGTALFTVVLAYSMITVAPQYQRDPSQVNKAAAESFRQVRKAFSIFSGEFPSMLSISRSNASVFFLA
jgi:hypothetical protein